MSKYFIPVEIEGKWELREWIGNYPLSDDYSSLDDWADDCDLYRQRHMNATKYPTLESDSAYWASKAGVKMTSEEFEVKEIEDYVGGSGHTSYPTFTTYAIPIQSSTTKELIEQEAERLYSHAELVDNTFPNYESVNNIHRTRLKRAHVNGYKSALSLPKQDNGDAWDEANLHAINHTSEMFDLYSQSAQYVTEYWNYLKQHYSISKIK